MSYFQYFLVCVLRIMYYYHCLHVFITVLPGVPFVQRIQKKKERKKKKRYVSNWTYYIYAQKGKHSCALSVKQAPRLEVLQGLIEALLLMSRDRFEILRGRRGGTALKQLIHLVKAVDLILRHFASQ